DVMMPHMDGWGVLAMIKADPTLADIPVVMVTMIDNKKMGYTLGASEYLTKPINVNRLREILERYQCSDENCPILVVEDNDSTRQIIRDMLVSEGWEVIEAENGRIALERLRTHRRPNLILLDLMMPEMDGFEFLEELRQHKEWQTIPVVVVTAMTLSVEDRNRLNGYVRRVLQKGAYDRETLLRELADQVRLSIKT
ncbi:MAG TPA: response regulator, partial [Aggregatilineales bacterium]|nr:response regulator [Aggregatilineales bacterium]